ncbi:MAG: peroxiredoxin [Deltaproteobacteria bacterium]|nr:MAG: peroxiredoxin [Deltaproteobacteria bacterium]
MRQNITTIMLTLLLSLLLTSSGICTVSEIFSESIYNPGILSPIDSQLKVKVGDIAPDFTLPAVSGKTIHLKDYRGKKIVVLSFVPAAWTPVCSDQWPGYNIVENLFKANDAILLGISVDNIPTLFSWTGQMGHLWFEVLSDFWPHGKVAQSFGILRSTGVSERTLVIIDKKGVIRYINVNDINQRPPLETLIKELQKISGSK